LAGAGAPPTMPPSCRGARPPLPRCMDAAAGVGASASRSARPAVPLHYCAQDAFYKGPNKSFSRLFGGPVGARDQPTLCRPP
jgi:hypothetical protein